LGGCFFACGWGTSCFGWWGCFVFFFFFRFGWFTGSVGWAWFWAFGVRGCPPTHVLDFLGGHPRANFTWQEGIFCFPTLLFGWCGFFQRTGLFGPPRGCFSIPLSPNRLGTPLHNFFFLFFLKPKGGFLLWVWFRNTNKTVPPKPPKFPPPHHPPLFFFQKHQHNTTTKNPPPPFFWFGNQVGFLYRGKNQNKFGVGPTKHPPSPWTPRGVGFPFFFFFFCLGCVGGKTRPFFLPPPPSFFVKPILGFFNPPSCYTTRGGGGPFFLVGGCHYVFAGGCWGVSHCFLWFWGLRCFSKIFFFYVFFFGGCDISALLVFSFWWY